MNIQAISRLLPFVVAGAGFAAPLRADVVTTTDTITATLLDWNLPLEIQKFNPSLGALQSVSLSFEATLTGDARVENQSPARSSIRTELSADIFLTLDGFVPIAESHPEVVNRELVGGFDGLVDFRGASGRTYLGLTATEGRRLSFLPGAPGFDQFIGPGTLTFPTIAGGTSVATGSGNVISNFNSSAAATIVVTYTFEGTIVDCNNNGIDDAADIGSGTSNDCNTNGIPDECEPDCDGDGVPNDCDSPCGTPCEPARNQRNPGSLLLYPEFDNRATEVTLITVTNTNCDYDTGTVEVEFVYIGRYGPNGQDLPCLEFNRSHVLTPCDTLTVFTSAHNPGQQQGYVYVFAKNRFTHKAIVFNHLIGQLLHTGGTLGLNDSVNAVTFLGVGNQGELTDRDNDGIRDLDGVEYSQAPDELLIPRFLGQDLSAPPIPGDSLGESAFHSQLILIALSGGTAFTTSVNFLVYNDNEEQFSAGYTFYCWDKPLLTEISNVFLNSYLQSTDHAANEILGAPTRESGWFKIDGNVATSSAAQIVDPAIYAVLVERAGIYSVSDLPFEICTQDNGDLLPTGPFGDL